MKYRFLLSVLRALMYVKRFFWRIGARVAAILGIVLAAATSVVIYFRYKWNYFLKRLGLKRGLPAKRNLLQLALFVILLLISSSQTKLFANADLAFAAQKTVAYTIISGASTNEIQEIVSSAPASPASVPTWEVGVLDMNEAETQQAPANYDLGTVVAGGTALEPPILAPGTTVSAARNKSTAYTVQPGDSLGLIAETFDVSVPTIMWANNLTLNSIIRPGDTLKIPPVSGVVHTVQKGDTLQKIAALYNATVADITSFNGLNPAGTNLQIGEQIMVPNGVQPNTGYVQTGSSPSVSSPVVRQVAQNVAVPPPSSGAPSASGFLWPTGAHTITQYFNPSHLAIDIAGPWQTPNYAAKDGTVLIAQCGWNYGYGCYIVLDNGGGIKTLYAHNSVLLVKPGDHVSQGQTIGLMGNTGNVRGITGIHLHFEVRVNNVPVNPLGYVHP